MARRSVKPVRFLLRILLVVLGAEIAVPILLYLILETDVSGMAEVVVQAALMVCINIPALWWGVIRPLRQRVLMERDRFEAVVDSAANGMLVINEEGIISIFNPAAEQIFGYRPDEIVGKNVSLLVPSPHNRRHDGYIRYYLRTGLSDLVGRTREVHGRRRDGSVFPMELIVTEARVGRQSYFTAVINDLSSRQPHEDDTGGDVTSHSRELAEFAHDLLTPVVAVVGHSAWLRERNRSAAEKADSIRQIHDSGWRLLHSIHNVIDDEFPIEDAVEVVLTERHCEAVPLAEASTPSLVCSQSEA